MLTAIKGKNDTANALRIFEMYDPDSVQHALKNNLIKAEPSGISVDKMKEFV